MYNMIILLIHEKYFDRYDYYNDAQCINSGISRMYKWHNEADKTF